MASPSGIIQKPRTGRKPKMPPMMKAMPSRMRKSLLFGSRTDHLWTRISCMRRKVAETGAKGKMRTTHGH